MRNTEHKSVLRDTTCGLLQMSGFRYVFTNERERGLERNLALEKSPNLCDNCHINPYTWDGTEKLCVWKSKFCELGFGGQSTLSAVDL